MPCQPQAPGMSSGLTRSSDFEDKSISRVGCSWLHRATWEGSAPGRRSRGMSKLPWESTLPATSLQNLAIAICMSTTTRTISSTK
jgi:hypothetical protein